VNEDAQKPLFGGFFTALYPFVPSPARIFLEAVSPPPLFDSFLLQGISRMGFMKVYEMARFQGGEDRAPFTSDAPVIPF
jgi:hypothetical protein